MSGQRQALILFAHGARDPAWADPLRAIQTLMTMQSPETPVRLAFLEFITPTLENCIDELAAQGVIDVTILPMFMAAGGHLLKDLPNILTALAIKYPALSIQVMPPVGALAPVQQVIVDVALAKMRT